MINRLKLLRNVGKFDSVNGAANIPFTRFTLIYGENGRGKTTFAAVLRSLGSGDPISIAERKRFNSSHDPHVVIECSDAPQAAVFQDNSWNRFFPHIVVFDDTFVDQNVHSGLAVDAGHRQNLHEWILGVRGVTLSHALQQLVEKVEEHNRLLRAKGDAIPALVRGGMSVEDFCALPLRPNIDMEIKEAERALAAAQEQDTIRSAPAFDDLLLPAMNINELDTLLQHDFPNLDTTAAAQVQAHLASIGQHGEAWAADGIRRVVTISQNNTFQVCPFCAQDLRGSSLINHYRAYFSAAYANLKKSVEEAIAHVTRFHGGEALAAFERAIRVAGERRLFWSKFCDVPAVLLDTVDIARAWRAARESVLSILQAKQAAPLERMAISTEDKASIAAFEANRQRILAINGQLQQANSTISIVKEQAATANPIALLADITRLKAIKARHTPEIDVLCTAYINEKKIKAITERQRDQARVTLDQHRLTAFPVSQEAINHYLGRFNAGFRLDRVVSTNTRAGSSCTYNLVINNTAVPVSGSATAPGSPTFSNTLSAGDRNTLALAFFFASLDNDPSLSQKIVVIDDPIASLDDHRSLMTAQTVRSLTERVSQVIILSHNKPFLCRLWEITDSPSKTALQIVREGIDSKILVWNVTQDCITENDQRHALLRDYLSNSTSNTREVARSIRPTLEAFFRVACPEYFPPGRLLGHFCNICKQKAATPQQILDQRGIKELDELIEYVNKFHHDTNPAWETESINDAELHGFVTRALEFVKP